MRKTYRHQRKESRERENERVGNNVQEERVREIETQREVGREIVRMCERGGGEKRE